MNKNKRKVISICGIVIVILLVAGIALYTYLEPYINAVVIGKELIAENYAYEIECYIEGVTLGKGGYGEHTVYIVGEKYKESLRSYIFSEEEAYLEMFANTDGDVLFNLRPTCQFISNRLEEALDIKVGDLVIDIEDTYLSLDNVEDIVGMDIVSPDDFGMDGEMSEKKEYKLERISVPEEFNVEYDGKDSYFFQLTLEDYDTKVIVGVPKSDKKNIYVLLKKDDIKLEMLVSYDKTEINDIEMPEETFETEQIESFKAAYKLWIIGKEAYDGIAN